ncbi:hypothetical protein GCK32_001140, partial [Trichostrongylus colubriformis]
NSMKSILILVAAFVLTDAFGLTLMGFFASNKKGECEDSDPKMCERMKKKIDDFCKSAFELKARCSKTCGLCNNLPKGENNNNNKPASKNKPIGAQLDRLPVMSMANSVLLVHRREVLNILHLLFGSS